ncbi:hypothetical protein B2J93_6952 [Marssonina coronariae]|uniref:Uncharacterized protein n=1 Tax=Diplocarpon coronariae TaxID=2795749 RepID=A0A218YW77_9HELO|nr:hypothetical protein B2J93_6952 [Marssonina coronariae]
MRVSWLPAGLREGLRNASCPRTVTSNHGIRKAAPNASAKFSTSTRFQASIAAPEIKFDQKDGGDEEEEKTFFARLVPSSPSYFTAQPIFTDDLLILQSLVNKYSNLPTVKAGEGPRVAWRTLSEYRNMTGETIKAAKYHKIVDLLQRLNSIHPSLQPRDVKLALKEYKRDISPYQNAATLPSVDKLGRTLGAGRRKSSTARAWIVEGTGEVLVNGKTLAEAFGRIHDRESAVWALKATDRMNKYNVWALVEGGGTTGQAEALTLAVGKALLAQEPALKPALRRGRREAKLPTDRLHVPDSAGVRGMMISTVADGATNASKARRGDGASGPSNDPAKRRRCLLQVCSGQRERRGQTRPDEAPGDDHLQSGAGTGSSLARCRLGRPVRVLLEDLRDVGRRPPREHKPPSDCVVAKSFAQRTHRDAAEPIEMARGRRAHTPLEHVEPSARLLRDLDAELEGPRVV